MDPVNFDSLNKTAQDASIRTQVCRCLGVYWQRRQRRCDNNHGANEGKGRQPSKHIRMGTPCHTSWVGQDG